MVELDYFAARYNQKNLKTVVTDVENFTREGYMVIKVGDEDETCHVNVESDLMTVINRVKPDLVVLNKPDDTLESFCNQIKVPYEITKGITPQKINDKLLKIAKNNPPAPEWYAEEDGE
jgi:hypothetical protein